MKSAKVFVHPSAEECLGVVRLEALESGTPSVVSYMAGIPDIIAENVGNLVPPQNTKAFQTAKVNIIQDEALWLKFSINVRKRAENIYDLNRVSNRIIDLNKEIIR
ncbi:MAG: glycosyltransferase [Sedimentibacter sp.]|jgi:glycosyltransferase involved in cell wall biosynthesis|nr:glycosyltransferase [Sedimentibacter sp.]